MPIRPENKARYPKNWPEIRDRIRTRSGNRCECTGQCGLKHSGGSGGALIGNRCNLWNGFPIDDITGPVIVLTVMHLDHTPENCTDENLLHGCQGCHNRYDAPHRRAGIKARAHAARATGDLFQCKETT